MNYKYEDYESIANDAEYIDEYDEYEYEHMMDKSIKYWDNYYHNIANEIIEE